MVSGATFQSKLGGGGAGCGQTEKGSQQRQDREEDGWMAVTRERVTNSFFFLIFFKFYFIFKLYIIILVLPNIKMNPPQVYMCSPS